MAGKALPYMTTDLLCSRHFKSHGIAHFPRDLLLAFTDHVLVANGIRRIDVGPGASAVLADKLGNGLVALLEDQDPHSLVAGKLPDQSPIERAYDGLLASLEQTGDWDTVEDDNSTLASLAIWEAYVVKHCIVPLLRLRRRSAHRAFRTVDGFIAGLGEIGSAPVRVSNGKPLFELPQRVQVAWWHHLMLGEIVRQLFTSEVERVFCPRRYSTVPGLEAVNLAFTGECRRHIPAGCGTFRKGQTGSPPHCLFEDALRVLALGR